MLRKVKWLIAVIALGMIGLFAFARPAVTQAAEVRDHYLFVYFKSPKYGPNDQQTYFAVSSDGLHYQELNNRQPVISSAPVRDQFIVRRQDGKGFYILGTSYNASWSTNPNRSVLLMSSSNLTDWTTSYRVLADNDAGCTWAPEAIWDSQTNDYLVYWAQFANGDKNQRMVIYQAHTSDFNTFSNPQPYVASAETDVIDPTVFQDNDNYVRFFKDEASKKVMEDRVPNLTTTASTPIASDMLSSLTNVEGPEMYQLYGQNKWILLLDHYDTDGYEPLVTTDPTSGQFTQLDPKDYTMPEGARHGSVLPISASEYNTLLQKWPSNK